jgi:phosphoribosyl-AMP cyclohydrolase
MSEIEHLNLDEFKSSIKYNDNELVPAIVQDIKDGTILMLGYMNAKSIDQTLEKGMVTFWSRSRQKYWTKGETSGNLLKVKEIYTDCDADTILIKAEPKGPTCHTGKRSCFSWKLEI